MSSLQYAYLERDHTNKNVRKYKLKQNRYFSYFGMSVNMYVCVSVCVYAYVCMYVCVCVYV